MGLTKIDWVGRIAFDIAYPILCARYSCYLYYKNLSAVKRSLIGQLTVKLKASRDGATMCSCSGVTYPRNYPHCGVPLTCELTSRDSVTPLSRDRYVCGLLGPFPLV